MNPEEIRKIREDKLARRVARMRARAERLEKLADGKKATFNSYHGDVAFFTQPAHPNSRFGRQRAKIYDRYDAGMRLSIEADQLREKADWIEKMGVSVKGDAEAKRQAERDENDKMIKVGTTVRDFCFGFGEVTRVNKKTYTIKFVSGSEFARDKSYVQFIDTQS